MPLKHPVTLCILDGFAFAKDSPGNAITQARAPFLQALMGKAVHLEAHGPAVGLPPGQMGNSEVGHMTMGAGRVLPQDLVRIEQALQTPTGIRRILNFSEKGTIHVVGMLSTGNVHASLDHLCRTIEILNQGGKKPWLHLITDGRDMAPSSALSLLPRLQNLAYIPATLVGRYYAMDRDKNWERTKRAYDLITQGKGAPALSFQKAIEDSYRHGQTDEFIPPHAVASYKGLGKGARLLFMNYRADRARQIVGSLLSESSVPFHGHEKFELGAFVPYSKTTAEHMAILFPPSVPENTLPSWIAKHNLRQLHVTETEKYAHVTFFFNGKREAPCTGEERILIPSPKVATYDMAPEMSAKEVTDAALKGLSEEKFDFILMNYANADMVGHTGNLEAAKTAISFLDGEVARLWEAVHAVGGILVVTADHGNAEKMCLADGSPWTAHTNNLVPMVILGLDSSVGLRDGSLPDVAPTILELLNLPKPENMTGTSLLIHA